MKIESQSDKESPSDPSSSKDALPTSSSNGNLQVEEKRRRAWEQWSADDIAAFFEGLNEFGKDFDAIQNSLITRSKKKNQLNVTNTKNKDQVRHFYYRTWHKISKYLLPTPDEGKRMHKELYGLINYGEMWKKLGGFFNDRCGEKLNELVQLGVTSVKIKGKSHRIKTPVCPALKRLQSTAADTQKLPALPEKIVMELTPCCNADFLRVQSVAHNPRIRVCSDSSSPFSNIISFLTKKWKPRSIVEADGQEQIEELDNRSETKSWILETAEQVTVGDVYTSCTGSDGRLQLNYSWEKRKMETDSYQTASHGQSPVTLLNALVNIAKTSLAKSQPSCDFSRMRQRLRRPLRYASSLKRNSLAATLNKMPGPAAGLVRPHASSVMLQPTTVNISWPPENDGNGSGSLVLQVHLDGQATEPVLQEPKTQPESTAPSEGLQETIISDVEQDLFRPPSILLHTPVKGTGWSASSTTSSLPATPNRLHEWMSLLVDLSANDALLYFITRRRTGLELEDNVRSVIPEGPRNLGGRAGASGLFTFASLHEHDSKLEKLPEYLRDTVDWLMGDAVHVRYGFAAHDDGAARSSGDAGAGVDVRRLEQADEAPQQSGALFDGAFSVSHFDLF
uniref:EOG090X01XB n=1 Tax=Moina brachiata TaxID=675436 RepID=A0A4Y7NI25_9CRUS|nr:EOG090X01XB [Moina brachiata]